MMFRSVALLCLLVGCLSVAGQDAVENPQASTSKRDSRTSEETGSLEDQRRRFALAQVISLADEARSYKDEALRARILAQAADTIWQADNYAARSLFRRAWEAAEKFDADKQASSNNSNVPAMAIALQQSSGRDLRAEVLGLIARRDRALAEEFLAKFKEQTEREEDSSGQGNNDSWSISDATVKRFLLARRLLDEGEITRALEFASPVLNRVTSHSIGFLVALRVKNATIADQRFANLMSFSEIDPSSDANTVSGLSSYLFTPNLYVTFSADGGVRWNQLEDTDAPLALPTVSPALLNQFVRTASTILLRPLLPPKQDMTSSGRAGKSAVIQRLLPIFEQHAPESARTATCAIDDLVQRTFPKRSS